jgi:hypothetical protein
MSRHDKLPKFKKNIVIKIGKPMYFRECYDNISNDLFLREITDKVMAEIKNISNP